MVFHAVTPLGAEVVPMMPRCMRRLPAVVPVLALVVLAACSRGEKTWFVIEQDGRPIGYHVVTVDAADPGGDRLTRIRQDIVIRSTLLGGKFDLRIREEQERDPATGRPRTIEGELSAGDMRHAATLVFLDGDSVRFVPSTGKTRVLACGPQVIVPDGLSFGFLIRDDAAAAPEPRSYSVLDPSRGRLLEQRFHPMGAETLAVAGGARFCRSFRVETPALGVSQRIWIDADTGMLVRLRSYDGMTTTLDGPGCVHRVQRWNMDDLILARVDVHEENFRDIAAMTVKARIRSVGERLTPGDLTVPGQTFTGTVEDNLIDGVFTVEHPRYDGGSAPSFPADWTGREDLRPYLEPELLIESDDPKLIAEARRITEGAGDAWEAAVRLSEWVENEIKDSVPGASARQTYDARRGECSAHSRLLAALCRGVGIPARLATGCAYTPIREGSFGQHVWNEVYMGDAGWIPVDCSLEEPDYIDSGHIRLGEMVSFNPEHMEILDYRLTAAGGDTLNGAPPATAP
jgi:hypothetical protein